MPSEKRAIIAALLSSTFSSVGMIFFAQAVLCMNPFLVVSMSQLLGPCLVLTILIAQRKTIDFSRIGEVRDDYLKVLVTRSFLVPALLAIGLMTTSGIKAVFISKMEPYLVVLWAWISGEAIPNSREMALLFVHIGGAILLSCGDIGGAGFQWGDLIILGTVFLSSFAYRSSRRLSDKLGIPQTVIVTEGLAGPVILILLLLFAPSAITNSAPAGLGLTAVNSVCYVFALSLWYISLNGIPNWLSSALRAIGPLIAAPFAWIVFGQTLTPIQILGGIIILSTSFILSKSRAKASA